VHRHSNPIIGAAILVEVAEGSLGLGVRRRHQQLCFGQDQLKYQMPILGGNRQFPESSRPKIPQSENASDKVYVKIEQRYAAMGPHAGSESL
jgi:hypothetical protein